MQRAAVNWCSEVAGVRHHRSLEGAVPLSIFLDSELPALSPLPRDPFELCTWSRPKVAPDCHIKVGTDLYSVPWCLIGRRVDARAGSEPSISSTREPGQDPFADRTRTADRLVGLSAPKGTPSCARRRGARSVPPSSDPRSPNWSRSS